MPAVETRIVEEGQLRFVQASGYTGAFNTASGAVSKLVAFCDQLRIDWAPPDITWIRDRGVLQHPKRTNDGGPYVFEARAAIVNTGTLLTMINGQGIGTASGASVPKVHIEYKSLVNEDATVTGVYYQGHHGVLRELKMEEGEPNMYTFKYECWSATLATASGYLA